MTTSQPGTEEGNTMNTTITKNSTATLAGFMKDRAWIGHANERKVYDGAVPRQDAIDMLSYPLAEASLTATVLGEDGVQTIEIPDRKAIVRTDTGLAFGIFTQGYQIHEPRQWCIDNVDLLLDGGLEIATVAVVKGGARVLLQAEIPEGRVATAPGAEPVVHRPRLNVATSMDGSIATTYSVGERLIICENELSLRGFRRVLAQHDGIWKVRHTSESLGRAIEVRAALGLIAEQVGDAFEQEFRDLVSQYVSDARWNDIVKAFTGVEKAKEGRSKTMAENKVKALNNLWFNDPRAASWKNSAYGVLAAFNTASHHVFGADKSRTERNQQRVIDGTREKFDEGVLRLLETV